MIKIVTDSPATIPEIYAKKFDITIIPLRVLVGDKEFEDNYDEQRLEMYEEVKQTKNFPKTSQPSLEKFVEAFNRIISDGNEVLCITLSATLSGTFNCATLAKSNCIDPSKVVVFNSLNVLQVEYAIVSEAVELISKGKTMEEIIAHISQFTTSSGVTFIPDSLEYLHRGGRLGKITAIVGSILKIKPIILFKNGIVSSPKKALTISKAIFDMLTLIPKKIEKLFIIEVGKSPFYNLVKNQVITKFPDIPFEEGFVGPVIGSHVGPAVGVAWLAKAEN